MLSCSMDYRWGRAMWVVVAKEKRVAVDEEVSVVWMAVNCLSAEMRMCSADS